MSLQTDHECAVSILAKDIPGFTKYKLRQEMKKHMDHEIPFLAYIPDGFVINKTNKTLHLYEVDGHSYTGKERIAKLTNLWWIVDGCGWFMLLTTINLFTGGRACFDDDSFVRLAFGGKLSPAMVVK